MLFSWFPFEQRKLGFNVYAGNNIYEVSDKFIINKVIRICISYTV